MTAIADRAARPASRRIALIDRPWIGYRSIMVATPVRAPALDTLRAAVGRFLREHPGAPLAGRIDEPGRRWLPVPAAEREAHLDRVVHGAPDPVPDQLEEHVTAQLPRAAADLPFVVVVSPRSISVVMSHAVGDAATLSRLVAALVRADPGALAALQDRVGTGTPLRALLHQARPHHREWITHLRRSDTAATPQPDPVPGPAPGPAGPSFAGRVITNPQMRELTRWRNAHLPGVPLNAVLTAAVYRVFTGQGLRIHGAGYYALFDVRSYLPPTEQAGHGNLAKSLYLAARLDDPRAIAAAMEHALSSARAIPAIVAATAASALPRRPEPPADPAGPMMLTMNAMPGLPGLGDLPWHPGEPRRFYGFGLSTGPGSITVFALRMREHMEFTVSFDTATAPAAAVRRGLDAVLDAVR